MQNESNIYDDNLFPLVLCTPDNTRPTAHIYKTYDTYHLHQRLHKTPKLPMGNVKNTPQSKWTRATPRLSTLDYLLRNINLDPKKKPC